MIPEIRIEEYISATINFNTKIRNFQRLMNCIVVNKQRYICNLQELTSVSTFVNLTHIYFEPLR